jgi:PKD repeat protein
MHRRFSRRGFALTLAGSIALSLALTGCEENTVPVITKLSATPQCGTIESIPPGQFGNTSPDTLRYLLVTFFARASSGNAVSDPTGANSPLEWRWDLDGDGIVDATNVVSPTFRYTEPGDYLARLEVEDDDGDKVARTIIVQVREESSELDTLNLEATAESRLRLTQLPTRNTGVDANGDPLPPEALPLEERFVFDSQFRFDGWEGLFDGKLTLGCTVTELFSQFDWVWELSTGATSVDLNPVKATFGPTDFVEVAGTVSVSELVTGVSRTDSARTTYPTAVVVRNGELFTIAPGATTDVDVVLLMPRGLTSLEFGLEYEPDALTAEAWNTDSDLAAAGFAIEVRPDLPAGRLDFRLTRDAPLVSDLPIMTIATVTFRNANVRPSAPKLNPVRVRDLDAVRDGTEPPLAHVDGFVRADIDDCNENELGDTMELLARGAFIDITRDGVIDFCADCNENDVKDGLDIRAEPLLDIDSNGLPDDCDCNSNGVYDRVEIERGGADADGNGEPDDCDCDWNGRTDLREILEHPSFVPEFDPQTGLVVGYSSDLDRLGGSSDLILDFCQDCNENGLFDESEIRILAGDSESTILAKFKLDIDRNGKLDACDCDLDDRFDRGQLERQATGLGPIVDADGDGLIDACDCDDNGQSDILEIAAGILSFSDLVATVRPGTPAIISGYRSNVDVNGDLVLDRCADCNENGIQDGIEIAQEPRLDIDFNGLPDACDCDGNDRYDPAPNPQLDQNEDGILDACDCDGNSVLDLEQIAFHPSTSLIFEGGVPVGYTSDLDQLVVGEDGQMVPGTDRRLDLCQDCDGNGVLDSYENDAARDPRLPRDLDTNRFLDACDCNGNGIYDALEISENPALDGDGDGLIDDCDCNGNGINDLLEIGAVAEFNPQTNRYSRAPNDLNGNLVLDECEGAANLLPVPLPERAERR